MLEARRGEAGREFDLFLVRANLQVIPVDGEQVEIALRVVKIWQGSPSCGPQLRRLFRLRSAKSSGEPLLAKNTDFAATDIELVTVNDDGTKISLRNISMPELPDITAYITALEARIVGQRIEHVRLASPFCFASQPPVTDVEDAWCEKCGASANALQSGWKAISGWCCT